MSNNYNSNRFGAKEAERRMSGSSTFKNPSSSTMKEAAKPISAVLTEEAQSSGAPNAQATSINSQPVKQSLLSKLTRNEGSRTSIGIASTVPAVSTREQQKSHQTFKKYGTECDSSSPCKDANNDLKTVARLRQTTSVSSVCGSGGNEQDLKAQIKQENPYSTGGSGHKYSDDINDDDRQEDEEDDDNQVIPSWPNKGDAVATNRASGFVQHKVYSLKDYSQVAHPSAPLCQTSTTSGSSGRLLKSLSQDRRADSQGFQGHIDNNRAKRLSECSYPAFNTTAGLRQMSVASTSSKQKNPSVPKQIATPNSASFSLGATNNLVARHSALMSESRIDRVRKLFVSPLSLRSGNTKVNQQGTQLTSRPPPAGPRLSLQGGSNMLNKPHHLMHAIYRTGGGAAHHSRRSPMRQKQGKSFRVYGCPLHMANNIYPITCFGRADIYKQQSVPYILARLCNYIEENSSQLTHEGIFRVSGNARLMEKLRTLFDHLGDAPLESESVDVATSASMLKMYLRELPEPLIPTRMNYYFITLAKKYSPFLAKENAALISKTASVLASSTSTSVPRKISDIGSENDTLNDRQKVAFSRDLTKLLRKLPIENYNLLKYLACFLYRISLKQQYNKMCAEALGIVFGPNVFRIRSESYKGLKEQELSNQIMASIISNYKCIFDSELTDPLGNLVDVGGANNISDVGDIKGSKKLGFACGQETSTGEFSVIESCPDSTSNVLTPSTSANANIADSMKEADLICYPPHIIQGLPIEHDVDISVTALGDDDEEDADDEEDDDAAEGADSDKRRRVVLGELEEVELDEQDEDVDLESENVDCDESYTPSSGSGSYCSSMDSDTLESSYEADEEQGEADNNDIASNSNMSSSECPSDTSYTPTSSHSDSEMDLNETGESYYGQSYSFESSPSFGKSNDPTLDNNSADETITQHRPTTATAHSTRMSKEFEDSKGCLVCRRRESAAAQLSIQKNLISESATVEVCDKSPRDKVDKELATSTAEEIRVNPSTATVNSSQSATVLGAPETSSINTSGPQNEHIYTSSDKPATRVSRKHRSDNQKRHNDQIEQSENPPKHEPTKVIQHPTASKYRPQESGTTSKSRHPSKQINNRFGFLRRRSSSASSLNRMKHKRDQVAHHRKTLKAHDETRRTYLSTAGHMRGEKLQGSTRRSKGKSHPNRKVANQLPEHKRQQTTKQSGSQQTRLSGRARIKSDSYFVPLVADNVSALNLSTQLVVEENEPFLSGWDFSSAQYLEELDFDRYFMLRPFNSDETLLRSASYCTEMAAQEQANTMGKPRRRFSGMDFDNKLRLVQVCRPCDQIFENYEEEVAVAAPAAAALALTDTVQEEEESVKTGEDRSTSALKVEQSVVNGAQPVEASLESSCVSLLDNNRLPGFRKSELSITAEPGCNPDNDSILMQIKAVKELISTLKRLLNRSANEYPIATRSLLVNLVEEHQQDNPSAYSNDCFTCNVDYLSAVGVIEQLDKSLIEADDPLVEIDLPMNEAFSIKIAALKQRYRDLKNIRDHHLKNHQPNQSEMGSSTSKAPKDERGSKEVSNTQEGASSTLHGSLDNLRLADHDHAYKDTNRDARERKLSAPNDDTKTEGNFTRKKHSSSKNHHHRNKRGTSARLQASTKTGDGASRVDGGRVIGRAQKAASFKDSSVDAGKLTSTGSIKRRERSQSGCRFGSLCPVEFVFNIEKQLASKRISGGRVMKLNEMSLEQLQSEKIELQKNLLRYEHWFGRPATRLECSLVGHLYERYQAVKIIKSRKQQEQPHQELQQQREQFN